MPSNARSPAVAPDGRPAPTVVVEVESDIPMAAGLGSSAAATVAGLESSSGSPGPLSDEVLLGASDRGRGARGQRGAGAFRRTDVGDRAWRDPIALRWDWPDELRLVVATPAVGLATAKARAALPRAAAERCDLQPAAGVRARARAAVARVRRLKEAVRIAGISRRVRRWCRCSRRRSIDDPDVRIVNGEDFLESGTSDARAG